MSAPSRASAVDAVRTVCCVLGGIACVIAIFLPLRLSGTASTEPAYRLAHLTASGALGSWAPSWTGVVLLLLPVIGAAMIATAPFRRLMVVPVICSLLALVIMAWLTVVLATHFGLSIGFAPIVVGIGFVIVVLSTILTVTSSRGPHHDQPA